MFKIAVSTLAALAFAAAPALQDEGDRPKLKPGDPAPALSIETWLKGEPVTSYEPGKLYVIEFWATWCGPCIQSMPHLSELQAQYREKGVTIVSVTSTDDRNTPGEVRDMVADKGDTMAYTVAIDQRRQTTHAFMDAAEQRGIPACFVVDGTGTVVYIGHPMWLDIVLEAVLAGTWEIEQGPARIAEAEQKLNLIFESAGSDPEKALELLKAFTAEHPGVAKMFKTLRFSLLLETGRLDEGYALGRELVAEAKKAKDASTLMGVAAQIVDPDQKLERRDLVLAFEAAKLANELTDGENPWALMTLARTHSLRGEHEQAIALQEKAVELTANEGMKAYLQGVLEELREAAR